MQERGCTSSERGAKHTIEHGGSGCAEQLGYDHEVLVARAAAGFGTAVIVGRSCGDTVSGTIQAIRQLTFSETSRSAF